MRSIDVQVIFTSMSIHEVKLGQCPTRSEESTKEIGEHIHVREAESVISQTSNSDITLE
jgi:hypothetical protein